MGAGICCPTEVKEVPLGGHLKTITRLTTNLPAFSMVSRREKQVSGGKKQRDDRGRHGPMVLHTVLLKHNSAGSTLCMSSATGS